MKGLGFVLLLFLSVNNVFSQGLEPIRRGAIGVETGMFFNRSQVDGVEINKMSPTVGTTLDFDFNAINIGLGMHFLKSSEGDKFFENLRTPDFGLKLAYGITVEKSSIYLGARFGIRTGIYEFSQLPKQHANPEIKVSDANQSSYYTGPSLSYRKRIPLRRRDQGYLVVTTEVNYLFGLGTYRTEQSSFEERVDENDKLFQQAMNVKLVLGWGKDM